MVFAKNTLMLKLERGESYLERKNDFEQFLDEHLCVHLDYVVPFFYSCFPVYMDNES